LAASSKAAKGGQAAKYLTVAPFTGLDLHATTSPVTNWPVCTISKPSIALEHFEVVEVSALMAAPVAFTGAT
jgi:hypothetical protein